MNSLILLKGEINGHQHSMTSFDDIFYKDGTVKDQTIPFSNLGEWIINPHMKK